jgi:hypothetical protein
VPCAFSNAGAWRAEAIKQMIERGALILTPPHKHLCSYFEMATAASSIKAATSRGFECGKA